VSVPFRALQQFFGWLTDEPADDLDPAAGLTRCVRSMRLDRLGRSVLHLVNLGADLRERGVGLRVTEQGGHRHRGGAGDVRDPRRIAPAR